MSIKSFVLRQGRLTKAQERAFLELMPRYGLSLVEGQKIDLKDVFPEKRDFILEIGFGNGESLAKMAQNESEAGFLGIEVHKPGVGHLLLQIEAEGIENLRLIRHDAVEVLRDYLPDGVLSRVQIYFPDPWQKARHYKRRLIQKDFLELVHRKLKKGGELHLASDWAHYAEWMRDLLQSASHHWQNLGGEDGFAPRPSFRPETKFERRGLNKGHGVWDLRYQSV